MLVFEDVHWAEPTLLDLIEHLADWAWRAHAARLPRPARAARGAPRLGRRQAATRPSFLLSRSPSESRRLVGSLGATELRGARRAPKPRRATRSSSSRCSPCWPSAEGAGEIPLPPTIQALLAARLDRLGPGERGVSRAPHRGQGVPCRRRRRQLSQAGRRTPSRRAPQPRTQGARSGPLAVRGEEAFRFRHVSSSTPPTACSRRGAATLHERQPGSSEGVGGGTAESRGVAGYHLEQAYRYRADLGAGRRRELEVAAARARPSAGRGARAFGRGDMPAAVNLLTRSVLPRPTGGQPGLASYRTLAMRCSRSASSRSDDVLADASDGARGTPGRVARTVERPLIEVYWDPDGIDLDAPASEAETAIESSACPRVS